MSYTTQFALVNDGLFRGRCAMSLAVTAHYVKGFELPDAAYHQQRLALAKVILANPLAAVENFIYEFAAYPAIADAGPIESLDSALDQVVYDQFNIKAGAVE